MKPENIKHTLSKRVEHIKNICPNGKQADLYDVIQRVKNDERLEVLVYDAVLSLNYDINYNSGDITPKNMKRENEKVLVQIPIFINGAWLQVEA